MMKPTQFRTDFQLQHDDRSITRHSGWRILTQVLSSESQIEAGFVRERGKPSYPEACGDGENILGIATPSTGHSLRPLGETAIARRADPIGYRDPVSVFVQSEHTIA